MHDIKDPNKKTQSDESEEMMLAEALYLYERDLEGHSDVEDED